DRQVRGEERLSRGPRIDPMQNGRDGRRLVHAEARLAIAADVPGVLQRRESRAREQLLHSELHEPAGMKKSADIATRAEHGGESSGLGSSAAVWTRDAANGRRLTIAAPDVSTAVHSGRDGAMRETANGVPMPVATTRAMQLSSAGVT